MTPRASFWSLRPARSTADLAAVSLVLLVAGAVFSGSDVLSAGLVGLGLLIGAPGAWAMRGEPIVRVVAGAACWWLLYGALVGSMPAPTAPGEVADWATTEGRVLVALAAVAIAAGVSTRDRASTMLRSIVYMVTAAHTVAFVLYLLDWSPPGFVVEARGFFYGFSSSHHPVAFLSAVVAIVVIAAPRLMPRPIGETALAVSVISIAFSGSRTAFAGLIAGVVVISVYRLRRRHLLVAACALVVAVAFLVASVDRFRQTARAVVEPGFAGEVVDTFRSGDIGVARQFAESEAEANLLIRIALWGEVSDDIINSPFIGMGAFRQNDVDRSFSGVRGVAYLATGGERRHNDAEPHNVVLYLLQEVGVLGLAVWTVPYVIVWRRSRPNGDDRPDDGSAAEPEQPVAGRGAISSAEHNTLVRATIVAACAMSMVSSGVLATGLGLIAHGVIFSGRAVRPEPIDAESGVVA